MKLSKYEHWWLPWEKFPTKNEGNGKSNLRGKSHSISRFKNHLTTAEIQWSSFLGTRGSEKR